MAKSENFDEILVELNKTLAKLTGQEKKVATMEFKAPTKEQLAAAAAQIKKQAEEKKKEAEQQAAKKPEPAPPAPPPEEKPKPEVSVPEPETETKAQKDLKKANIPPDTDPGQVLRVLVFYPAGSADITEVFFSNLEDVLHKTTKKKFYVVKETAESVDYAANDLKTASVMSKDMNADAVFFISKDPVEIEFSSLYSRNITTEQVKKRFFFVDLVVELVLAKKK